MHVAAGERIAGRGDGPRASGSARPAASPASAAPTAAPAISSIGRAACSSGSTKSPCAAPRSISSTASASSRRQRHLGAGPAWHRRPACRSARSHVGRHVAHAHELEQRPREDEAVAGLQARDEAFLDRADAAAGQVLHLHRRVGDDGADAEPVAPRDAAVRHAVDAVVAARCGGSPDRRSGSGRRARRSRAPSANSSRVRSR